MLEVLARLAPDSELRFTAIAPAQGPLAARLQALGIPILPLTVRSNAGRKRELSQLTDELLSILSALQPDVLHANSLSMSRLTGQLRTVADSICCTGHIRDIMKLSGQAVRDLNRLDRIAVVSRATRDFHVAGGLCPDLAEVIYNGVDTARFRRRPPAEARCGLLPELPASATVLLNVGQICLRKGQLDLAHAVIRLLESRDNLHLVLIGERYSEKAESGIYDRAISEVFAAANRSDHLHRLGYRDDVEQWMNAADVLVHTAHQEPLGRVLLEAAASELPVIATAVGGTSEILGDQNAVHLLPPGDIEALTGRLWTALNNPVGQRSLAAVAADRIRQRFGIERACGSLRDFWKSALHG